MNGGLIVFSLIFGGFVAWAIVTSVWFQRWLARQRKVTRRYSEEYAPYVVKHLAKDRIPFAVRWTQVQVFSPRPARVWNIVTAHVTFPYASTASVDLAQADAAEESRRDDERKRDEEIARRYADRPTVDLAPHTDVLTF